MKVEQVEDIYIERCFNN